MTEFGLFTIAGRTARGYLLPWGVKSKGLSASGTKPIAFPRGNVTLPRDPMVIGLNDEHARFKVIGRATVVEDREEGIYAEFQIADTEAGDAWLTDHEGKAYFSAEVDELRRTPADEGYAILAGAAVTGAPAFEGTAVFSLIGEEEPIEDTDPEEPAPDEEPDEEPDETEEEAVAEATVATTAQFSRKPSAPAPAALTKQGFFSALAHAAVSGEGARALAMQPYRGMVSNGREDPGMFALSNIKYDGTGGLAADAALPNAWLGELFDGERARSIVPLLTPGTLEGIQANGWVWTSKPAMAAWAGNKVAVPSNAPAVAAKQFYAQRYAGGHDLAREYYDFGQTEMVASYFEAMVDSYASLSDGKAYAEILAGGTAFTPGAAGTVGKALSAIVDGALAVVAAGAVPTFAIVAPNIYREILLTPSNTAAEYLSITAGLSESSAEGFKVIPWAGAAAGQVIVGAKRAVTAWELPGSPIRVSAPDLVLGGIDNALFGYIAVGVLYPAAVVKAVVTLP